MGETTAEVLTAELVVLCGPDGSAVGTADKRTVHGPDTPLHLAFSCYVFDDAGRLLVTRRASSKPTWPGVRTNSCCGHPGPGEPMSQAVRRRLQTELGIEAVALDLVLPEFRYRAQMANGVVENELCPIYRAYVDSTAVNPDPAEVDAAWWVDWAQFVTEVDGVTQADGVDPLSPWSALQVPALLALAPNPADWIVADAARLPAAAVR